MPTKREGAGCQRKLPEAKEHQFWLAEDMLPYADVLLILVFRKASVDLNIPQPHL